MIPDTSVTTTLTSDSLKASAGVGSDQNDGYDSGIIVEVL